MRAVLDSGSIAFIASGRSRVIQASAPFDLKSDCHTNGQPALLLDLAGA